MVGDNITMSTYGEEYLNVISVYINGEMPNIVSTGDMFIKDDYEYKYNYSFNETNWVKNEIQNGWEVRFLYASYKEIPNNALTSINGKPVIK